MSRTLPLRITLLAALTTSLVAQEPDAKPLTEDQRALFALLDEFDPLDTSELPFVRFEIDHGTSKDGGWGFLIARDELGFRVRTVPYGQRVCITFQRHADAVFHGSFVPATLADVEAWMLARKEEFALFGSIAADWLVVARAYARRGAVADVHRLWTSIPALHGNSREHLRDAIARAAIEWLNEDFVDPSVSWQQLAARHDLWLARFGGKDTELDQHVQRNRAGIGEVLAAKAERTKRRTNGPPTPADLVFDLHDEFWLPPPNRGESLVCSQLPPRDGDTPLRRVKNAGLACVPDLIAALDDGSLTRSVHGSAHWMVTIPVGRFGDAADAALLIIAGYRPDGTDRAKAWNEWYELARSTSAEAVRQLRVDELHPDAVRRYLEEDGARLPRVLKAIAACKDGARRRGGVQAAIASIGRPLPTELLDELTHLVAAETDGQEQVWMAKLLVEHGRDGVVDVVAKSWLAAAAESANEPHTHAQSQAAFLMEHGPSAWTSLEKGCAHPRGRASLARVLAHKMQECRALARGPIEPHLLRCLTLLRDDESIFARGFVISFGDREYQLQIATIADIAAARMAECWPDEHHFDPTRTTSVRRSARHAARFHHDPEPPRRDPPVAPNLVTRVTIDASGDALSAEATASLRSLEQRELTEERLEAKVRTVARTTKDKTIVVDCERTGLGDGTRIHVSLSDADPSALCTGRIHDGYGTRAWQMTIAGATWKQPSFDDFGVSVFGLRTLADAFTAPATSGVELRYVMRAN